MEIREAGQATPRTAVCTAAIAAAQRASVASWPRPLGRQATTAATLAVGLADGLDVGVGDTGAAQDTIVSAVAAIAAIDLRRKRVRMAPHV